MRIWLFRLHLWSAVLAGTFFIVLGITGALIAFQSPLDRILNAKLSYVPSSSRNLSLGQILDSVKASYPSDDAVAVSFETSPNLAWRVALPSGIVYINPHTGQVLGLRKRAQNILGFAHDVHVALAAGRVGRTAIRWINLAALVLLVSGFLLWWQHQSIRLRAFNATRRPWMELHKAIGVFSFPLLFVASCTGAVMSFEQPARDAIRAMQRNEHPPERPLAPLFPNPKDSPYIEPEKALTLARSILPAMSVARIQMPEYGGTYQVSMLKHSLAGSDLESVITLDPYTGKMLSVSSSDDQTFPDTLFALNESLHTGSILGVAGRTLMSIAGIMILPQAISGLAMWWKRFKDKARRGASRGVKGVSE